MDSTTITEALDAWANIIDTALDGIATGMTAALPTIQAIIMWGCIGIVALTVILGIVHIALDEDRSTATRITVPILAVAGVITWFASPFLFVPIAAACVAYGTYLVGKNEGVPLAFMALFLLVMIIGTWM